MTVSITNKQLWHHFLILVITGLSLIPLYAQTGRLFQQYDDRQGLSNSWVSDIFQDSRGFIWVGTQYGLNRFDGYRFRFFTYSPNDTASIGGNWVLNIGEDREGQLWIGTYGDGVNRFDPVTEKFRRFQHDPNDPASLAGGKVFKIHGDRKGRLWLATDAGICLFQSDQNTFRQLSKDHTFDIEEDDEGRIWAATSQGLFLFDENTQNFHRVVSLVNPVTQICSGKDKIWVFDDESLKTVAYRKGQWVVTPFPVFKDRHPNNHFDSPIFRDSQGRIWAGVKDSLAILSADGAKPEYLSHRELSPKNHPESYLISLTEDRQGNIWMGTSNGISVLKPSLSRFRQSRFEQDLGGIPFVREILAVGDTVWYATAEGLFRQVINAEEDSRTIVKQPIYALCRDDNGRIYAASSQRQGFYQIHSRTLKQTFFGPEQFGDDVTFRWNIYSIVKDLSGRIWMSNEGYLQCFHPATHKLFSLRLNSQGDGAYVLDLMMDKTGNLWVGTLSHGVFFIENIHQVKNPEDAGFINYRYRVNEPNSLSSNSVLALHQSMDGNIWVGTDGGLNLFEPESRSFRRFLREDGLVDDKIMDISSDKLGRLWLSTIGHGIVCFDVTNETFFNFTMEDGLYSNDFMISSGFRSEDGTIFFGSEGGLQIFHPDSIFLTDTTKVPLFITKVQIEGQSLIPGAKDGILTKSITFTDRIVLKHNQSNLYFQFAALHFSQPSKTEYAYKLKGLQQEWQAIHEKRDITFASLPPGEYEMTVQAKNRELGWTTYSRPLQIEVQPPWWQSAWAYTIYFLLLATLLYGLYRFQLTRNLAMAEREQLKKLDAEKSRFYTNITHEFRTPLTLISGPLDRLLGKSELQRETRDSLKGIKRNADHLLRLINNVLDMSRLESGLMKASPVHTDVGSFVRSTIDLFESYAREQRKNISFINHGTDFSAMIDREKFRIILSNLIANAIKFSSDNSYVTVDLDRDEKHIFVSISNTGSYLSPAQMDKIFDRFYRVENNDSEGSGLGLPLVKELTNLLEGDITVISMKDDGTSFKVTLPLVIIQDFVEKIPDEKARPDLQIITDNKNAEYLVLLVEDNDDVAEFVQEGLQEEYKVYRCSNGKEGLQKAIEMVPDIIISDVMMPIMDGYSLCNQIKNHPITDHIPFLLLTARADTASKIEGMEKGADAYLVKPFNDEELKFIIRNTLSTRKHYKDKLTLSQSDQGDELIQHPFLIKYKDIIIQNLTSPLLNVDFLCKKLGISRTQLHRKIKALTTMSAMEVVIEIKLEKSIVLLRSTDLTISEIAYDCGFSDPAYFAHVFSKHFNCSASQYREKLSIIR